MLTASFVAAAITAQTPEHQCDPEFSGTFCDCIPDTYEDAIDCLGTVLDDENQAILIGYRYDELVGLHHGFGTGIRNAWLWGNRSPAVADMSTRGFLHPDDMSTAIVEGFWARHNGCEIDLDRTIRFYTTYWHASAIAWVEANPERASEIVVPIMDHDPVTERPVPDCPFPLDQTPPSAGLSEEG